MFRLNIFLKLWFLGKCLRMSLKNSLSMFVLTFKLKGGLNQITFLFQFCLVFWDSFLDFSVAWHSLFLSAVSYAIFALLNSVLLQDKLEMRLLVIDGNCLMIDGRWLDFVCIYRCALFGFIKGKYFPVFKLKKTSQKFVSMRFVSIVTDSPPSLNKLILIMFFLSLSTVEPLASCTMASPSSLYKPTLLEPKRGLILFRRYNPTSSHTSVLSKLPIVTSNNRFPSFFTQAPLSSNKYVVMHKMFSVSSCSSIDLQSVVPSKISYMQVDFTCCADHLCFRFTIYTGSSSFHWIIT